MSTANVGQRREQATGGGMTIWMVVRWHNPFVSHGYEPEQLFLSELSAARYADKGNERAGIVPAPDGVVEGEFEVQVWEAEV